MRGRTEVRDLLAGPQSGKAADPSSGASRHLLPQGEKGGADFSFASSDFKTLGAFFCNLSLSRLVSRSGTLRRAPDY
jgi:hypothetical protein